MELKGGSFQTYRERGFPQKKKKIKKKKKKALKKIKNLKKKKKKKNCCRHTTLYLLISRIPDPKDDNTSFYQKQFCVVSPIQNLKQVKSSKAHLLT